MRRLIEAWKNTEEYRETASSLKPGTAQLINGLPLLPRATWAAALYEDTPGPLLLITATEEEAQKLYDNIYPFLGNRAMLFPALELLPFEVYAHNLEVISARVGVLSALAKGEKLLVIAWAGAVLRLLPAPEVFLNFHLNIKIGDTFNLTNLSAIFGDMGYERVKLVDIPGTYSIRGSLIDIYPLNDKCPTRIEFFDDEVESLRYFNAEDQISREHRGELIIPPGNELPLSPKARESALLMLEKEVKKTEEALKGQPKKNLQNYFKALGEKLEQGIWDSSLEQLVCYFYPQKNTLLNYFSRGLIILNEPEAVFINLADIEEGRRSRFIDLLEAGQLLPSFYENFIDAKDFAAKLEENPLVLFGQLQPRIPLNISAKRQLFARVLPKYNNNYKILEEDYNYFRSQSYQVFFSASSSNRLKRVEEIVKDLGFPGVHLLEAGFTQGFESSPLKIALISEEELISQERKRQIRRPKGEGKKIESFLQLQAGDYIVHINQGIGLYLGVERLKIGDIQRDYLHIQYAGNDRLYLPVDQLDLIQKYIGDDAQKPKLNKMGGGEWQRMKAKVRKGVEDMAKELLALYAAREAAQGYAFSEDTPWQKDFEDVFPYQETPDQLQAAREIKKDMESSRPMDRLLCGDVGYGKTEIALRAAFKAVSSGKQVAMLVPTTVLAQQHLHTFKERFANYPVTVAGLSRFFSQPQQKKTISKIKDGRVDIVIGTHRLLSKDINYHDLGLLIIDEEQRFGVAHKEKIKELKSNVDVLTLSATPIPRTLHMALVGMRDMSVIATPPEDRQPVQTYVVEYHERLVRDVISREIDRGGQVYFVHNRVQNIYQVADKLAVLLPKAKISVAHGQMNEKELEKAMMDFVENKANVLVCTTIIESGLDIPNVNTLIAYDADCFGLSQLYQLRGRVGRSQRQAFAYFTYRKDRIISETAKKRLIAIRDFTELGAGFKIAMRDMEIRGAGNILGPQQHGHIAAVGFDLYCRLLQEEIDSQAGKAAPPEDVNTLLELDIDAYLPDSYIDDSYLKVEIYRRIASAGDTEQIDELERELKDRYGKAPPVAENLLLLGKIKVHSRYLGIASIIFKPGHFEIKLALNHRLEGEHLIKLLQAWPGKINFYNKKEFMIKVYVNCVSKKARIEELLKFLTQAGEIVKN